MRTFIKNSKDIKSYYFSKKLNYFEKNIYTLLTSLKEAGKTHLNPKHYCHLILTTGLNGSGKEIIICPIVTMLIQTFVMVQR